MTSKHKGLRALKRVELAVAVALIGLLYVAYTQLPKIDPRTGVDVWGSLIAIIPVLIAAVASGTIAWVLQASFFEPLTDTQESGLYAAAQAGSWSAAGALLIDWLKWLVPFWLIFGASIGS